MYEISQNGVVLRYQVVVDILSHYREMVVNALSDKSHLPPVQILLTSIYMYDMQGDDNMF